MISLKLSLALKLCKAIPSPKQGLVFSGCYCICLHLCLRLSCLTPTLVLQGVCVILLLCLWIHHLSIRGQISCLVMEADLNSSRVFFALKWNFHRFYYGASQLLSDYSFLGVISSYPLSNILCLIELFMGPCALWCSFHPPESSSITELERGRPRLLTWVIVFLPFKDDFLLFCS